MITDDMLRQAIKVLKAIKNISYREFSKKLSITEASFYQWLRGSYDFSEERKIEIKNVLESFGGKI